MENITRSLVFQCKGTMSTSSRSGRLVFGSLKTAFERLVLDSAGDDQASKAEKWGGQEGYREAEPRCDIGVSGKDMQRKDDKLTERPFSGRPCLGASCFG
jgi:hypothetical protein